MTQFHKSKNMALEDLGEGVKRHILGYESDLMLVRVYFEKGAVGIIHTHPHQQVSYVEKGRFEVEIAGEKEILDAGDCFAVQSNTEHVVVALAPGILIDAFSPSREDFLTST